MNKIQLPYGLRPYEIGYLILLGLAFYYSGAEFRTQTVPVVGMPRKSTDVPDADSGSARNLTTSVPVSV